MKQKLLSKLLAIAMVLTLLPAGVFATYDTAGATTSEPGATETSETKTGDLNYAQDNETIKDFVYTNGTMTVTGANVTIENVTFGDGAALKVNTSGNFTLENCTFNGKTEVRTPVTLNVGSATVTGNTFNGTKTDGTPTYYNAIEFAVSSGNKLSSATLSNNIFEAAIKNNYFSTYYYADNAVITAENNVIKLANRGSNAIRISNVTNSNVTFNLNNNSYEFSDASGSSEYEGFIILQDFSTGSAVQDFSKVTLNIKGLTTPDDATRLLYVYDDQDKIIQTNQPVVKGDSSIEKFFAAKVGDNAYVTLAAAIAAANNGETVTLMKDVTEKVSISKNLVLDLNGKTLTGEDLVNSNKKNERIALTANAGKVEVKNGIIDGRVNAYDGADLTIDADVTVKNSYNGSGYDCFGVVVWGDGTFGQNGCKTPKLTVNGKVIMEKGGVAISTNGNDKSCAVVTINDGAVISTTEDGAIYLPSGKLTMNGGTVSGPTGIQICAGSANITSDFKLHNGTVIATGADQRTSKGTGDGLIPDGAAISVVNRNYPNGVPSVTIDGGSFSSANSDAVLAYSWSNGTASEWTDAKTYVKINDGYFTSDPTAYLTADHYVWASDKDGYAYMVKDTAPAKAEVIVSDGTAVTEPTNKNLTDADKTAIQTKTNVDGVAEAVAGSKNAIVEAAKVDTSKVDATKLIEVKVAVDVAVSDVQKNAEGTAISTITFTANPTATVTVDGAEQGQKVPVTNDMLNRKPITVKLPLPTGFEPKQIKHTSADGSVEYFLNHSENGAGVFKIENGCAVFTITKFSTFELSGTQTYVAPVYAPITKKDVKFDDVDVNAYYAPAVKWAVENKITAGKTDKLFAPDDTCTRGEMITFLWNAAGKPAAKNTTNPFTDVNVGAFYYDAVLWAVSNGITSGTSETTFSPDNTVNRAQVVAFLYNYANKPAAANSTFSDVAADAYYAPAVGWAAAQKITSGTGNNTFSPENDCTRAQIVTFLYNDLAK